MNKRSKTPIDKTNLGSFIESKEFREAMGAWARRERWTPEFARDMEQELALVLACKVRLGLIRDAWPYIKQIKWRVAYGGNRRRARQRAYESQDFETNPPVARTRESWEEAEANEEMNLLARSLSRLDARQAKIVEMWSAGHTFAAIANTIGMPLTTAYMHYHEAIGRLRQMMAA